MQQHRRQLIQQMRVIDDQQGARLGGQRVTGTGQKRHRVARGGQPDKVSEGTQGDAP